MVWRGGTRGTAVIFPGRTEYAEKYGPVAGELVARGFAVAVIDWRGQGLSDRHPRNAMLGHVHDFADYQRDVAALMALVGGAGPAGAALPRRAFDGRLHRDCGRWSSGRTSRRDPLGADVGAAPRGGDAADRR